MMTLQSRGRLALAGSLATGLLACGAPGDSETGSTAENVTATATSAFYVGPNGSDKNNGTSPSSPFATLGKCQTAMRGSSTKTCYILKGNYSVGSNLPMVTLIGSAPTTAALKLTSADDGTTWSYYPPDGYNSAVFDGGNDQTDSTAFCQRTDMLDMGIYIGGGSHITVNGLQFQHFSFAGFLVHGGNDDFGNWVPTGSAGEGTSDSDVIENNIVQDINNGPNPINPTNICKTTAPYTGFPNNQNTDAQQGGLLYAWGQVTNLTVSHNVGQNMMATCLQFSVDRSGDSLAGLTVNNNYCNNTGTAARDVGALHLRLTIGVNDAAPATGAQISNNYLHDCGAASKTAEPGSSKCMYMDDLTSGISLDGNILAGHFTFGAFIAHGGHDNTWTGNIVDLGDGAQGSQDIGMYQDSTDCTTGSDCMTNDVWQNNIVIANSSYKNNGNYSIVNPNSPLTSRDDLDVEYGGGSIADSASVSDADPGFTSDWTYSLPASSSAYRSPVKFPQQPAAWGQPGFWGPPGYVVPQTGTRPSYLP
jgi:hypothetical protein